MTKVYAFAAQNATDPLGPFNIERRDNRPHDVSNRDPCFAVFCHSDIHQARNEWGGAIYPMVTGS
jgi:uncharacterized zinc-type alcohol dehydrogenase-like protein